MALPEEDPPPGVPEWVVTYGDMMSLLLTFFIMLVSLSALKQDGKVRAMLDSVREAFGASLGESGVPGPSLQTTSSLNKRSSDSARSEGGTRRAGRDTSGRAGAHRTVERISHGTVVTLGGPSLFERFDATLTPALEQNLDVLAGVLAKKLNRVVIRGHASREPLPRDSAYRDALDLSFARARSVADYLEGQGIDRRRIVVSAAADSEPRVVSREPSSQRLNRRVDVFLIDSYITPALAEDRGAP